MVLTQLETFSPGLPCLLARDWSSSDYWENGKTLHRPVSYCLVHTLLYRAQTICSVWACFFLSTLFHLQCPFMRLPNTMVYDLVDFIIWRADCVRKPVRWDRVNGEADDAWCNWHSRPLSAFSGPGANLRSSRWQCDLAGLAAGPSYPRVCRLRLL